MNVEVTEKDNQIIFSFRSKMDTKNSIEAEDVVMERVLKHSGSVVFGMQDVDYIASAFIRLCIKVVKSVGQEKFSLSDVRPPVKKVFKTAGLDFRMT